MTKVKFHLILILISIAFAACSDKKLSEKDRSEISTLKNVNRTLLSLSEHIHTGILMAFEENRKQVSPIKEKTDSMKVATAELYTLCEEFFAADTGGVKAKADISELKRNIKCFSDMAKHSLSDADSSKSSYKLWKEAIDFSAVQLNELHKTDWLVLQNKIQSVEYLTCRYLHSKVKRGRFLFNNLKVIVVPETRRVKAGGYYRAEIFPISYDTTKTFTVIIDRDTIVSKNGVGTYLAPPAESLGLVRKQGLLLIENPSGYDLLKYPFDVEYEVVK